VGVWLARLSRVPYGSKEAWMLTGEDVRVRGQKRRMREEMTLTLTLTLTPTPTPTPTPITNHIISNNKIIIISKYII